MNGIMKLLFGTFLLCLSQLAFADCNDPDAPPDCITITPDDSIDTSSGGGGFIYTSGGSSGGSQEGNSGNGGTSGQTTTTTTTPSDPPKTPRQTCLEESATKDAVCRAKASADYVEALATTCAGLGSVSGGISVPIFGGSVTVNDYEQCKDIVTGKKENAERVCVVLNTNRIQACP